MRIIKKTAKTASRRRIKPRPNHVLVSYTDHRGDIDYVELDGKAAVEVWAFALKKTGAPANVVSAALEGFGK